MPAKPLSAEQLQDAARLKAIFNARKGALGLTQETLAEHMGYANQSAVSGYFNGKSPLHIDAAIQFASWLGCRVGDFSPTLQAKIDAIAVHRSDKPPAAAVKPERASDWPFSVARTDYDALPKGEKKRLDILVRSFIESLGIESKRRRAAA
ncbi:transcriptional regulator [Bordetella ansorpii]|uniref:Transcriptional regulator n=1 Tax=Bordetella ansorpii TaxID=288768 RepID=A0A157QNZ3_9BORD|nr:helix-turn-helix transcriptional regulator [Bordetella ansorpii]SAI47553.1 transcriptional regulator [Bordetella ansorpii]